jgi:hypothetical protein
MRKGSVGRSCRAKSDQNRGISCMNILVATLCDEAHFRDIVTLVLTRFSGSDFCPTLFAYNDIVLREIVEY